MQSPGTSIFVSLLLVCACLPAAATVVYEDDFELYKIGGEGAYARVAISDHADYFAAGRRTLLEPIAWSNGKIEVRLRDGWFDLSEPDGLYINIVYASNQQVGSIRL